MRLKFTGFRLMGRFLIMIVIIGSLLSCSDTRDEFSLKGLATAEKDKNVALIFGAPNNLLGVPTDVRELKKLFADPEIDFHFKATVKNYAKAEDIFKMTGEKARTADSLLWYFSGHGTPGGLVAEDKEFSFKEILDEIKKSRKGKPLKRFIVFLDSCFSGSFLSDGGIPARGGKHLAPLTKDEEEAAITDLILKPLCLGDAGEDVHGNAENTEGADSFEKSDLFKQAFVIVSSKASETSEDLDKERGGAFTYSLRTTIKNLRENKPDATLKDLAFETRKMTKSIAGHTPVYRAVPKKDVEQELLFSF